jgi:molybdopterin/thiamine biosynthesis adenylyltransferase/rhodanese-related sulfurtransferase
MKTSGSSLARYSRQMILPGFGIEGQERLRRSRVLVVGVGGLGSPAALYLAAAGVGVLGLADQDAVERHNLHRQILHTDATVGCSKLDSAEKALKERNPEVQIIPISEGIRPDNARAYLRQFDLVVDGSDNFPTRYLVNDAAVLERKPLVYGSVFRDLGQVSFFDPARGGPCYRCLFPEPPAPGAVANCAEAGVLGPLAGTVGSLQACQALQWITGRGQLLRGKLWVFDLNRGAVREVRVKADPHCPVCGADPVIREIDPSRYGAPGACPSPSNGETALEVEAREVSRRLDTEEKMVLLDVREPLERRLACIEPSLFIPMGEIGERWRELPRDCHLYVYCHHGMRSMRVVRFLRDKGMDRVFNIAGGIEAWSETVDPAIPRY